MGGSNNKAREQNSAALFVTQCNTLPFPTSHLQRKPGAQAQGAKREEFEVKPYYSSSFQIQVPAWQCCCSLKAVCSDCLQPRGKGKNSSVHHKVQPGWRLAKPGQGDWHLRHQKPGHPDTGSLCWEGSSCCCCQMASATAIQPTMGRDSGCDTSTTASMTALTR